MDSLTLSNPSRYTKTFQKLSILCTAIQHGKMPQIGIRTQIFGMSVIFKSPLAATTLSPFSISYLSQEKGLIKSQSFTCALIGLHHSWVWQPCEVITFCKYLDDTWKSDSFNQFNELKKFWQVQMTPWHVTSYFIPHTCTPQGVYKYCAGPKSDFECRKNAGF